MMSALDPARAYPLADVFGRPRNPVYPNHEYFVAEPPDALALDADQLRALGVRAPFFVDHGWSFGPNPDLVPFVWDRASGGQRRFSEAESLTDYDAGSFGLAAVSAPTAEAQAQLYRVLTHGILDVHRADRELLAEWWAAQGTSSRDAFLYFDAERPAADEKLLAADGTVDRALWETRIDELAACISTDAWKKHHFRWVEFLAHAVDVPRLVALIRAAQ
jgi:hypothetical protein